MPDKLETIKQDILANLRCSLKDAATNLVFGKGNPDANILVLGESPGANEDREGLPFVGAAGKQLDKLLSIINLTMDDVYIANILKYRPPKNRNPTKEEIKNHTPYLIQQIKAIKPKLICTLGNFATKFVLAGFDVDKMKHVEGITSLRGKPKDMNIDGFQFTAFPLFHPAAMLYNRKLEPLLEEDFKKIGAIIQNI
jgi:uracil-DNA glycosylase